MFPIPQQQIRSLLSQITEKSNAKEQRLQGCVELRRLVLSLEHLEELNNDRDDVLDQLKNLVVARGGSLEVKKALGECLAALGALQGEPFIKFTKWIDISVSNCHPKAEEERAILVRALASSVALFSNLDHLTSEDIREMMTMAHRELDKNESETVLGALLELCLNVAHLYPDDFMQDFEDVVDVTVGWLIDPSASSAARTKCDEILSQLHSFWPLNTDCGIKLMTQFLEDTIVYLDAKELIGSSAEMRDALQRAALLLDALNTVLKGFALSPSIPGGLLVFGKIQELLRKACSAFAKQQNLLLITQTKQSRPYLEAVVDLLTTAIASPNFVTNEILSKTAEVTRCFLVDFTLTASTQAICVDFFNQIALTYGVETLQSIVDGWKKEREETPPFSALLGPRGAIGALHLRAPLTKSYTKLLNTLMNSRTPLPQLQAVYAIVAERLKENMNLLREASLKKPKQSRSWKEAEETILACLCALKTLSSVKNSLIVMMGLRPSLFQLLVVESGLGEEWLVQAAPLTHQALLIVAKRHAETHDCFLSTSDWLNDGRRRGMLDISHTARYAAMQLALLASLLSLKHLLKETREEAVDWLASLCAGITDLKPLKERDEWRSARRSLQTALLVPGVAVSEKFRLIFKKIAGDVEEVPTLLRAVGALKAEEALALWNSVSPRLFIRSTLTVSGADALETGERRVDEAAFGPAHFRAVAAFLLSRQPLSFHNLALHGGDDWTNMQDAVDELFAVTSTLPSNPAKANAALTAIESGGTAAKWRWLLAQTANYCVENRMRTYLGKPMETFNQIGAEIQRLAREAMTQKAQDRDLKAPPPQPPPQVVKSREKRAARGEDEEEVKERERVLTKAEEWWRVHCLLEFFEVLDKMIFNAFNGTTFPLAPVSQPARQFFVTNMAACQEWLSRTYLPAMAVAVQSGHAAMAARFGHSALFELERKNLKNDEGERDENLAENRSPVLPVLASEILVWQTRALVELGAGAALRGLRAWGQRVFKVHLKWIDAAADFADGRLEPALATFRVCLVEGKQPENIVTIIRDLMLDILGRLRLPHLVDRILCPQALSLWTAGDEEEAKTPSGFDELAFQRVKALSTFVKLERGNIEAQPSGLAWDIGKRTERRELELLSTLRRTDVADMRAELANDARALTQCIGGGAAGGGGSRLHLRVSLVSLLAGAVALKMTKKEQPDLDVNANVLSELDPSFVASPNDTSLFVDAGERLRTARQLSLWAERLGGAASPAMHIPLAHLARKLHNPTLASLHLGRARSASFNTSPLASTTIQLHVSRQGAKMVWDEGATSELSSLFNSVFTQLSKALEVHTTHQHMAAQPPPMPRFDPMQRPFPPIINGHHPHDLHFMDAEHMMMSPIPGAMPLPPGFGFPLGSPQQQLSPVNNSSPLPPQKNMQQEMRELEEEMSKTALNLAQWLKTNPDLIRHLPTDCTRSRLWMLMQSSAREMEAGVGLVKERPFEGALRTLAPRLAPQLSKAHRELAEWVFQEAERGLAVHEETTLKSALLSVRGTEESAANAVIEAARIAMHEEELEEAVKKALATDPLHSASLLAPGSQFRELWNTVRRRRVALSRLAVDAFFAHIDNESNGRHATWTISSVSSTLRLLDLLVRFHEFVADSFDLHVQTTNEQLWKDILPQLFARLAHPSPRVRSSLLALLSRVAIAAPHALIYPVVVGAQEKNIGLPTNLAALPGEEDEEPVVEKGRKEKGLMAACCVQLEAILEERHPDLVKDVKTFVDELRRVSLLSEERWFFVLGNLDQSIGKQMQKVEMEKEKTLALEHLDGATKQEIIAEKARLLTGSVFSLLEDLYAKTCAVPLNGLSGTEDPRSNNEKAFADLFGEQLRKALEHSRQHREDPEKAWMPFKEILRTLFDRSSRRGGHAVQIADISNWLSRLSRSSVPVPGQETSDWNDVVMLQKVGRVAVVLPTKTRPKKITLGGSDGKEQVFLFKGQEDLHLDERVMQFLRISNLMLASSEAGKGWPSFEARHYSVTPLGARSGLIQWVNGATPLFHIYRKWQLRQAQIKAQLDRKKGAPASTTDVKRAADIFLDKVKATLKASQLPLDMVGDRNRLPATILKDVLQQLMRETPRDLLSRELWMRAGSGDTWWRVLERFSRSTAVTSMLGAVLGVGDRHLDNVLVSLETGQVVHIDYNVCFEKGRQLKVPETVPFRLSPNLVHALGPAYTDGTFGSSCVSTLAVLRSGASTLTSLLEAFIFDPLVDWASAHQELTTTTAVTLPVALAVYGTDGRAENALPITRYLFVLRVKELAIPWMENWKKLADALKNVCVILEKAASGHKEPTGPWQLPKEDQELKSIEACRNLKSTIAAHHHMMKELRPLLRTLAHSDTRYATYLKGYREQLSDPLIRGHQLLEDDPLGCVLQFRLVLDSLNKFYTEIFELSRIQSPTTETEHSLSETAFPPLPSTVIKPSTDDPVSLLPPPGFEATFARVRAVHQQENAIARSNVRKVRAKLEGRVDPNEPKRALSPSEQVDLLIRQATSSTNLALMYEGWMAWV